MRLTNPTTEKNVSEKEIYKAGFLLIGAGILLLIDQYLKTSWLSISIPALLGFVISAYALINKRYGLFISGCIALSVGLSFLLWMGNFVKINLAARFGLACLGFALCWLILFFVNKIIFKKSSWWVLLVCTIVAATGYTLIFTKMRLLDFTLFLCLAIGLTFLLWGFSERLFGLLIAGSIITTTGLGIYLGWNNGTSSTGLLETGTMLVWFALGWLLITVCGRLLFNKFVWWPIIPGGIIGMVGLGLYIGGGKGNTAGFISNTGSIALILFGLYLILLKFGMRK